MHVYSFFSFLIKDKIDIKNISWLQIIIRNFIKVENLFPFFPYFLYCSRLTILQLDWVAQILFNSQILYCRILNWRNLFSRVRVGFWVDFKWSFSDSGRFCIKIWHFFFLSGFKHFLSFTLRSGRVTNHQNVILLGSNAFSSWRNLFCLVHVIFWVNFKWNFLVSGRSSWTQVQRQHSEDPVHNWAKK